MAGELTFLPAALPLSTAPAEFGVTLGHGKKPGLSAATREMETMFLSLLLKEMRQAQESEEGGLFAGDTADVYGGLFDLYMSKHLADSGGIGLTSVWLKQLEQTQRSERLYDEPSPGPTNTPGTGMP